MLWDSFVRHVEIWPFLEVLGKLLLAIAVGTFVGLEREHEGKAGVRTFALTALLGAMGGLLGGPYAVFSMVFAAVFIVLMNAREMVKNNRVAMTTSAALAVVAFAGAMCGGGHFFTPVAACILAAALLAWKQPIAGFAGMISYSEIRSAILLAVLALVIYPVLPEHAVDPWGLVEPRENWIAVIAIAAIGFANYVLLRAYGAKGMEVTAFFGGLVNSRKVMIELLHRTREAGEGLAATAQRGIALATAAMAVRNALIVAIFARAALPLCAPPLALMLAAGLVSWWLGRRSESAAPPPKLQLESPFKLSAALKFGLVFLALNVLGGLAERATSGAASFYVVSVLGGLVSSASSIASAATLVGRHSIPVQTGAFGVIVSTITSVVANIPLVWTMSPTADLRRAATRRARRHRAVRRRRDRRQRRLPPLALAAMSRLCRGSSPRGRYTAYPLASRREHVRDRTLVVDPGLHGGGKLRAECLRPYIASSVRRRLTCVTPLPSGYSPCLTCAPAMIVGMRFCHTLSVLAGSVGPA